MASQSQLLLLADHIKLSLLERQRAISLKLEPNSQDAEISRSLNTLHEGLEHLEASSEYFTLSSSQDIQRLIQQYNELYSQFTGNKPPSSNLTKPNDPSLAGVFSDAQERPPQPNSSSKRGTGPGTKFVRFTDSPSATPAAEDANRTALFPYKDDPDDDAPPDHGHLDNQQIHEYHSQVIREQDNQLDRLGQSVGRQRELSIQIGDELDDQAQILDDVDEHVNRHQTQIDKARSRLGKFARKAKDNMQLTIIGILIIILVLLIIILK